MEIMLNKHRFKRVWRMRYAFLARSVTAMVLIVAMSAAGNGLTKSYWDYQMSGVLDDAYLTCHGEAVFHTSSPTCWSWELFKIDCDGKRYVDWLHDVEPSGTICRNKFGLMLETPLPGNSYCVVRTIGTGDKLDKGFKIWCAWQCRSGDLPCTGNATYKFNPKNSHSQ